jgi:hypothetical protein
MTKGARQIRNEDDSSSIKMTANFTSTYSCFEKKLDDVKRHFTKPKLKQSFNNLSQARKKRVRLIKNYQVGSRRAELKRRKGLSKMGGLKFAWKIRQNLKRKYETVHTPKIFYDPV